MGRNLQIALDRATVLPGVLAGDRVRFFRRTARGPSWEEHLAIADPALPELRAGTPARVEVDTLGGRLAAALRSHLLAALETLGGRTG
jgi:hypothetical protein